MKHFLRSGLAYLPSSESKANCKNALISFFVMLTTFPKHSGCTKKKKKKEAADAEGDSWRLKCIFGKNAWNVT